VRRRLHTLERHRPHRGGMHRSGWRPGCGDDTICESRAGDQPPCQSTTVVLQRLGGEASAANIPTNESFSNSCWVIWAVSYSQQLKSPRTSGEPSFLYYVPHLISRARFVCGVGITQLTFNILFSTGKVKRVVAHATHTPFRRRRWHPSGLAAVRSMDYTAWPICEPSWSELGIRRHRTSSCA